MSSERLAHWLASRLDGVNLPVVTIDGIHFKERVVLIALGFDTEGEKHVLGIHERSTENTRAVCSLISDPGAAASLRERVAETLTLITVGLDGALYRTFRTTNPIENLNGLIAHYTHNVKRWRDGEMVLRWMGTARHESTDGFRAARGFRDMKRPVAALEEHVQLATRIERKIRSLLKPEPPLSHRSHSVRDITSLSGSPAW